jgi:membrane protease YdiL (CAAX protease family)
MSPASFAAKRPVLSAVLCAALQFLLTVLILQGGAAYAPPELMPKVKLVAFASTLVLPILLATALGLWGRVGLGAIRPTPLFLLSLVTCALFLAMGVHAQPGFGGEFLMQFLNATGEELLFRGVIFALLIGLPTWQGIVLSGLLFGSMHLIHGYMDGQWLDAFWRTLITACAGMMFTAVRYDTRSLWLTIFLHMALNLSMIYSNIEFAAGPTALLAVQRFANVVELALVGWFLRKGRRSPVIAV